MKQPGVIGVTGQRNYFSPHWSVEAIEKALDRDDVFKAVFYVNAHNRFEAYCRIDGVPIYILIGGVPSQNRALNVKSCEKSEKYFPTAIINGRSRDKGKEITLFQAAREFLPMIDMVKDFNIAESEEDISAYVGYVGSSFMLGRSLTSILWGIISDRYGRKPVIIVGVMTVVVFNTLFGLSTNLWMAISMRYFLGSLNGLIGPVKVVAAWGVGLVISPALGGYLAQPTLKYPHLFAKDSFWDKFPYFLPCFVVSAFAFVVAIACIWFPETLHYHNGDKEFSDNVEAAEVGSSETEKDKTIKKDESIFLNWPLMSSIIAYCVFSLHDIAYQEVFSLWVVSPRRLDGLNFTIDDVGNVMAISGFAIIIYQLALYPSVQKACGPVNLARIIGALSIPLLQSYPFMNNIKEVQQNPHMSDEEISNMMTSALGISTSTTEQPADPISSASTHIPRCEQNGDEEACDDDDQDMKEEQEEACNDQEDEYYDA